MYPNIYIPATVLRQFIRYCSGQQWSYTFNASELTEAAKEHFRYFFSADKVPEAKFNKAWKQTLANMRKDKSFKKLSRSTAHSSPKHL